MDIDALKNDWQRQDPLPAPSSEEVREMIAKLDTKLHKMNRSLWWRDLGEIAAVVLVLGAMAWIVVAAVNEGGPLPAAIDNAAVKGGAGIIVFGCLLVTAVLLGTRMRHRRPRREDLPVADFLRSERARIDAQIRLLENVAWWYVLPLTVGPVVVFAGVALNLPSHPVFDAWRYPALAAYTLAVAAFGVFLVRINRRAARSKLQPLRDDIERGLEELGV